MLFSLNLTTIHIYVNKNKIIDQIALNIISSIILLYIQNLHISQTFPLLFSKVENC